MKFDQLQKELINAMKAKNSVRKTVISDIMTCAKNMAIEKKNKDNITEDIVTAAILKTKKIYQEQIDTCPTSRKDKLKEYQLYMSHINEFAPKMMTEDETRAAINHILATIDIQHNNKGALMKAIMPRLKGKADGKIINKIVTEILNKTE